MKSLEQERASLAWEQVKQVASGGQLDGYRSLVREFPAMVQSMGLGQSVAFLMAKGEGSHRELLNHLSEWLLDKSPVPWTAVASEGDGANRLIERLLQQTPPVWWAAEREAIEFAIWLKRFAEALYESQKAKPASQGEGE